MSDNDIPFPSKTQHLAPFAIKEGCEDMWVHHVSINMDGYSRRIITFAADWAWLMELEMARTSKPVHEIADKTSRLADYDGITGFMYGAAVAELAACWTFGDELKRWHNGEYGNPDAEGVLNPALLVIKSDQVRE